MNSIRAIRKALLQKFLCVIRFGNNYTRCIKEFIEPNLKISGRENIVGMRGKAKSNSKKSVHPESGARGHSSKVRVDMTNPHFLQSQSNIDRLIEPKKIGAPAPLIESADNLPRSFSLFCRVTDFSQQLFLLREVLHAFNDTFVPVLRRFIFWFPNGENRLSNTLASELSNLAIAKCLSE